MDAKQAQETFKSFDLATHVKKKGMWAGAVRPVSIPGLCGAFPAAYAAETDTPYEVREIPKEHEHTPALLKSFDELLVNASDHAKECEAAPGRRKFSKVTYVRVSFTPEKGVFEIENDGPGIPIVAHSEVSKKLGREVYIPEIAFCHFLSGSNMEKKEDSIKGGVNGVGAKIANVHSVAFRFTTVSFDSDGSKMFYSQRCLNGMKEIEPPQIVNLKKPPAEDGPWKECSTPCTRIQMLPSYRDLGYNPARWRQDYEEVLAWLRLRCCQLAAYLGPKVEVALNGERLATSGAEALARLYFTRYGPSAWTGASVHETTLKPKDDFYKKYPISVAAVVSPELKSFSHVSVINGVVTATGPHLTYLKELLKEAVLKKLRSATRDKNLSTTSAEVCKHVYLAVVGPLPGADWTGQRKDELTISRTVLKNYTFAASWLREVADVVAGTVLGGKKPVRRKKPPLPDKYTPATLAGARKGGPVARLLVAEGDSAIALLRTGLGLGERRNPGGPSFRNHGVFSLGGVPMNAAKQVTEVQALVAGGGDEGDGQKKVLVRSQRLQSNKALVALENILGLDHACTYESEAERRKLNYSHVIACVDQDVDGAGKILGILLTYFHLFWPALIQHGYVKWFMTPVIRAYPASARTIAERVATGPLGEFYHEQEFYAWAASPAGRKVPYKVEYYKGLGGHDDKEVPGMFRDFDRKLYTFTLDDDAEELFETYFGAPTGPRKLELSTPLRHLEPEEIERLNASRQVPCSVQLRCYAKAYKLDALERQLPGALDSFTSGRRKAFAGARLRFGNRQEKCMTYQLAGFVADKMAYHHGGASMENAITRMCQTFPGARQIPLLVGSGSFGSRFEGGKDAAAARYTKVSLNTALVDALLPREDDWLLPYEFVDGVRAQPQSYVPVLPLTALDNMSLPSEGWRYRGWGRRVSQVAALVRAYCLCPDDPDAPLTPEERYAAAVVEIVTRGREGLQSFAEKVDALLPADGAGRPPLAELTASRPRALDSLRELFPLDISLRGVKGKVQRVGKTLHHFGEYEVATADDDPEGERGAVVRITELPLQVWSHTYVSGLTRPASGGKPNSREKYIEKVTDYSGEEEIRINVVLRPGALKEIHSKYGKEDVDAIEDFLKLHSSVASILNVIRPSAEGGGGVIEFGEDYHSLVIYFLSHRRRYYKLRYERKEAILKQQIRCEREILRYMDLAPELQIPKIKDEKEAHRVLAGRGFPLIALSALQQPRFASVKTISTRFVVDPEPDTGANEEEPAPEGPAADDERAPRPSYGYILNLRERDLLVSAREKRRRRLAELEQELQRVEAALREAPFPAASAWLADLDRAEAVLREQNLWS